MATYLQDDI